MFLSSVDFFKNNFIFKKQQQIFQVLIPPEYQTAWNQITSDLGPNGFKDYQQMTFAGKWCGRLARLFLRSQVGNLKTPASRLLPGRDYRR